jgi:GT2 family glycosyltransferase/glycosyltransferase involved in cell wall biosynthesis
MSTPVSIVLPVYAGLDDVTRCLASVARHAPTTTTPFELIVIEDASPDPEVTALVASAATADHPFPVTVVHNEVNRGFVASVNLGFDAAAGDVIVLNADTVVTEGWLDRLADAAAADDVATVTPLTNSGSICTLPQSIIDAFGLDGPQPRIDECGQLLAGHGAGLRPEVITGVGFCMYVTRAALDLCGRFDEETFGRGYGEEVDFCLRATRLGLRHLVEDSTFVYHRGGGSFGDERDDRLRTASRLLHRRYRFFRPANRREQAAEPLAVSFASLELGLVERDARRPHVLHLLHGPPTDTGGTEKHLLVLLDALGARLDFSILYPVEGGFVLTTRWHRGGIDPVVRDFLLPGTVRAVTRDHDEGAAEALALALDLFDVDAVHIHNVKGQSLAPFSVLADFEGPVVCSVHDLYLACPHYSLLYLDVEPCGLPDDLSVCQRCFLATEERPLADLERFRDRVAAGAPRVDRWVLPSHRAAENLLRGVRADPDRLEIIEHGSTVDPRRIRLLDPGLILEEPLRVAFVGRGWAKKGLRTVDHLADRMVGRDIEVHHFGPLTDEPSPNLRTHGPYDNELLGDLLHRAGIQVVVLPGAYAETFGLVMSEAIVAGIPVIGATYGALGERIRAHGAGWTIDPAEPDVASRLVELVERLDANRDELLRATRRVQAIELDTVASTAPRYAALYGRDDDPQEAR